MKDLHSSSSSNHKMVTCHHNDNGVAPDATFLRIRCRHITHAGVGRRSILDPSPDCHHILADKHAARKERQRNVLMLATLHAMPDHAHLVHIWDLSNLVFVERILLKSAVSKPITTMAGAAGLYVEILCHVASTSVPVVAMKDCVVNAIFPSKVDVIVARSRS